MTISTPSLFPNFLSAISCAMRFHVIISCVCTTLYFFSYIDSATIQNIISSVAKSWIGQKVKLLCLADGGPAPTVTWIKPDGSKLNSVTFKENTIQVNMSDDQDFGLYTCKADNDFGPTANQTIKINQISKRELIGVAFCFVLLTYCLKWIGDGPDCSVKVLWSNAQLIKSICPGPLRRLKIQQNPSHQFRLWRRPQHPLNS